MTFWGPRSRIYLSILSTILIVALFTEWRSVQSFSIGTKGKLRSKVDFNDSRQLRMQSTAAVDKLASSSGTAPDSSTSSRSSSSTAAGETRLLQLHPELGTNPDVQHYDQTVHGRMEKKGHLHWEHWSTRKAEARFDNFLSWRINRTLNGPPTHTAESYTCAAADHPKLPFPGCHVFINHK